MQDNFDLKGFLRNNKLLNEGIGGYFDLIPLKEAVEWDEDSIGSLADKAIDRMQDLDDTQKEELKAKVGQWISDILDGKWENKTLIKLLNQHNGEGSDKLGDVIMQDYESDEYQMNELNDLGNMEEDEDSFIQANRDAVGAKGSSMYGDQNDDDDSIDHDRFWDFWENGDEILTNLKNDDFQLEDVLEYIRSHWDRL